MDFINDITTETLIICNKYTKEDILKIDKLLKIKIMNRRIFRKLFFFIWWRSNIIYHK